MKKAVVILTTMLFVFVSRAAAEFRAGVAVRVVTPDPLLPVSGGIGPSNPVKEKRGDLTVRALVLENNGVRVAIVGADFLGFPSTLGNKVRAQVKGIPPQNILIGATHTHSAPDCYGFPDGKGGFSCDLKYLDMVCAKMAEAINEAVAKLQPASVKIATGEAQGKIAYNYYAPQLYDPRCSVIQCLDASGKPFATLVNYAIHPEVLGDAVGILSPDLCGPLYERIEARGGGTAIFMNGALGGMITADNRDPADPTGQRDLRTWEECVRIGTLLADEALRIVADAPVQKNPTLFCAATTITFPIDSEMLREIVRTSPVLSQTRLDGWNIPAQVNVVNLGNAQILTIPGEALPNIGYYLKRKMHGEHNLLFGLTNDAFGYILTKVDWNSFKRYDYISRTCLGEMTGEIFIEKALEFVNRCPRPQSLK
ncbi:MAG: hypothetical protein NZT92_09885 [Abditibacteriales bacterium]|nr:hypothetical protein [Abditibacteriales bacterium]MDW8366310.1 hypothetical protein [Abditibacteriales bacterium]